MSQLSGVSCFSTSQLKAYFIDVYLVFMDLNTWRDLKVWFEDYHSFFYLLLQLYLMTYSSGKSQNLGKFSSSSFENSSNRFGTGRTGSTWPEIPTSRDERNALAYKHIHSYSPIRLLLYISSGTVSIPSGYMCNCAILFFRSNPPSSIL